MYGKQQICASDSEYKHLWKFLLLFANQFQLFHSFLLSVLGPVHPFYDPPLDEHLCQEILWPLGDGQVPQQCKRRPRAGRDRCWQHGKL